MASMSTKPAILLLFVAALLCHIHGGEAAGGDHEPCQPSDIHIWTVSTGKVVGGKPERVVTVENQCSCPQDDVVLSCPGGLANAEAVDRTKIHVVDAKEGLCLVYNGWPLTKGSAVTFAYASTAPLDFSFYNATPRC